MDNQKDWKKKYKAIIAELESKQQTWGNLESLLRKAIARLALPGLGIDKRPDAQLKNIQTISRKKNDDKLSTTLDNLSDILNALDDQKLVTDRGMKDELATINAVMTQLLVLLALPEEHLPSFERIKSYCPPSNTDSILNELASGLSLIMAIPLANDAKLDAKNIDAVILGLLDRLSMVPGMNKKAKNIQASIRLGLSEAQWPIVLDAITQQVSGVLQLINDKKNALENFIEQVTEQLLEITAYISDEQAGAASALSDAQECPLKMPKNVQSSDAIESLKQLLDSNIHSLKNNINAYLSRGKECFTATELRNKALSEQIVNMQKETQELKICLEENKKKLIFDTLTGIHNRMGYNDHIKKLIARWQRYDELFSYAIIDIDYFKNVNDAYGHNTGDKVLKIVATIMKKNIRESDTLFRIGGEEFVLILPNTDINNAALTIEKIRKAVSACDFRFKEDNIVIHLSAGLTQVNDSDDEESLYERADKGLYQAKESGRNKLVKA